MFALINTDKSVNCVSDKEFTSEFHNGLTLVEIDGVSKDHFPGGAVEWGNKFFDFETNRFLSTQEFNDKDKTQEELTVLVLQRKILKIKEVLQKHLDDTARNKNYDSIHTAALRAALPNSPFHAEGVAFGEWMDACNAKCYELLTKFQSGEIAEMTPEEVIAQLPKLVLP